VTTELHEENVIKCVGLRYPRRQRPSLPMFVLCLTALSAQEGYIEKRVVKTVVTGWSWWGWTTRTVKKKLKIERKKNKTVHMFCL